MSEHRTGTIALAAFAHLLVFSAALFVNLVWKPFDLRYYPRLNEWKIGAVEGEVGMGWYGAAGSALAAGAIAGLAVFLIGGKRGTPTGPERRAAHRALAWLAIAALLALCAYVARMEWNEWIAVRPSGRISTGAERARFSRPAPSLDPSVIETRFSDRGRRAGRRPGG